MSLPTEIGPVSDAFARRYGQQGESLLTLASDLFPVVNMGDGEQPAELMALTRQQRFSGAVFSTPAAGQFAVCALLNPIVDPAAPSVTVAVVERIMLHTTAVAGGFVSVHAQNPGAVSIPGSIAGVPWDNRYTAGQTSMSAIGTNSLPASITARRMMQMRLSSLTHLEVSFGKGIVVMPGTNLVVCGQTADMVLNTSFFWRERVLTTWELRL